MTWTSFHRRGDVLRDVIAAADQRRDGVLPRDVDGVSATFADDLDLLGALQLKWHTRLAGRIEREQMTQPLDLRASVVRAWHQTADELPGIRAILDEQRLRPADDGHRRDHAEVRRQGARAPGRDGRPGQRARRARRRRRRPDRGRGARPPRRRTTCADAASPRRRAADAAGSARTDGPGCAGLTGGPGPAPSLPCRSGVVCAASGDDGVMVDPTPEVRAGMLLVATPAAARPQLRRHRRADARRRRRRCARRRAQPPVRRPGRGGARDLGRDRLGAGGALPGRAGEHRGRAGGRRCCATATTSRSASARSTGARPGRPGHAGRAGRPAAWPGCGSSPGTPAGAPSSSPPRSRRAAGTSSRGGRGRVPARPGGALARRAAPPARRAGLALDPPCGSRAQLIDGGGCDLHHRPAVELAA